VDKDGSKQTMKPTLEGEGGLEGTGLVLTKPSWNDVVLGARGPTSLPGNVLYRELCRKARSICQAAPSPHRAAQKSGNKKSVAEQVMWTIQGLKPPGRFLEREMTEDGSIRYRLAPKDLVLQ
jgi:hypothetical protein